MSEPEPEEIDLDEDLVAYLDGELSPEKMTEVEERLAADPVYRARLQDLERAWEALDQLPTGEPTAVFVKSTMELVVADVKKEQSRRRRQNSSYWLGALALAIIPFLFLFISFGVTQYIRTADQRAFLRDLDVIEKFEMYDKIDRDIIFLEMLDQNGLFVGEITNENK